MNQYQEIDSVPESKPYPKDKGEIKSPPKPTINSLKVRTHFGCDEITDDSNFLIMLDDFIITDILGEGGQATVYKAFNNKLGIVALKVNCCNK